MDQEDGLISAGTPDVQLTWMDAKVDGWVVTPRNGKAVEVNAWYNALKIYAIFQEKFEGHSREVTALARRVRASFHKVFWNERKNCLFDYIKTGRQRRPGVQAESDLRGFSAVQCVLDHAEEKAVVDAVFAKLYTSFTACAVSPPATST